MKSLLSVLSLFVLVSTTPAAVLVNYTFSGSTTGNIYDPTNTNTELNPSNVAANTTASDISQSGPIAWRFQTGTTDMSIYPGNTAVQSSTSTGTAITTASDAVLQGSYFKFTLTANGGFELNMSSLTFDAAKGGSSGSRGFAIQTSATGFSTDSSTNVNSSGVVSSGAFTTLTLTTFTTITLDLSGASYQHLSSLEVRIFSFSPTTASSLEYDNFATNGSVVSVPEPTTWGLLAGAGTALLVLRRRRK